jgi:Acetoacetate decarboxylase (ADC)
MSIISVIRRVRRVASIWLQPVDPTGEGSPPFIQRAGQQLFKQPYQFQGASLRSFLVEGDCDRMQSLCDAYLNEPANGRVKYFILSRFALVSVLYVKKLQSVDEPDKNMGCMDQVELSIWLLAVRIWRRRGRWLPRLVWFSPYLFLNNPLALVAGREVYGYPKAFARITPTEPDAPGPIAVETLSTAAFGQDVHWTSNRLLTIEKVGENPAATPRPLQRLSDACEFIVTSMLRSEDNKVRVPGLDLVFDLFEAFDLTENKLVFLKQFRDVKFPSKACYQAIVESTLDITAFHDGGLMLGDYALTLEQNDAYPIAGDIGLKVGTQPVDLAVFLNMDIRSPAGEVIAESR